MTIWDVREAVMGSREAVALENEGWEPFAALSFPAVPDSWLSGAAGTPAYVRIVYRRPRAGT